MELQMKKSLILMLNLMLSLVLFLSLMTTGLWSQLQSYYKKGVVSVKENADFGKDTDWDSLILYGGVDIAIAPDGSIFLSNSRRHFIYKFDRTGKFLKKFGRRGEGPGDFVNPGDLSILDKKYLIVGEYASNRRFTVWDLDGNFVKVVRAKQSVFDATAVSDNKVAYRSVVQHPSKDNGFMSKVAVTFADIESGEHKTIATYTLLNRSAIRLSQYSIISIGNFFGEVFFTQTGQGNLLIYVTNQPVLEEYSPLGKLKRSIDLNIQPIPVTAKYISQYKEKNIAGFKKRSKEATTGSKKNSAEVFLTALKKYDFTTLFDKHHALFYKVMEDSEGNILVFKNLACQDDDCKTIFQVYSRAGKYVCEAQLVSDVYNFRVSAYSHNFHFTSDGIIGLFMQKDDEDEVRKLVKSPF